jgi:hypothetical protein
MKTHTSRTNRPRRNRHRVIAALTLAAALGLAAGPALADNDHGNRGRNEAHHAAPTRVAHHGGGYRAYDYYGGRGYSYAPPVVVYAPYAPPAIDFVFPFHIR